MGDAKQIDFGDSTLVVSGIRVGATGVGQSGTELTGTEIALLDGITAGTVTASKAVVVDASKNMGTFGNVNMGTAGIGGAISVTGASTFTSTMAVVGQPTFLSTAAVPAGGSAGLGVIFGTSTLGIYFGSGVPTSNSAQGSIYLRTDGSNATSRMYVNTTATSGWVSFTTAS